MEKKQQACWMRSSLFCPRGLTVVFNSHAIAYFLTHSKDYVFHVSIICLVVSWIEKKTIRFILGNKWKGVCSRRTDIKILDSSYHWMTKRLRCRRSFCCHMSIWKIIIIAFPLRHERCFFGSRCILSPTAQRSFNKRRELSCLTVRMINASTTPILAAVSALWVTVDIQLEPKIRLLCTSEPYVYH